MIRDGRMRDQDCPGEINKTLAGPVLEDGESEEAERLVCPV